MDRKREVVYSSGVDSVPGLISKDIFEKGDEDEKSMYNMYGSSRDRPLFVNVNQFNCIKKRKMRRDFLDLAMKKNPNGYLHESRHKHAMNRLRAPSGRFLTKEETELIRKAEEKKRARDEHD